MREAGVGVSGIGSTQELDGAGRLAITPIGGGRSFGLSTYPSSKLTISGTAEGAETKFRVEGGACTLSLVINPRPRDGPNPTRTVEGSQAASSFVWKPEDHHRTGHRIN
jgi:hypothetical protein